MPVNRSSSTQLPNKTTVDSDEINKELLDSDLDAGENELNQDLKETEGVLKKIAQKERELAFQELKKRGWFFDKALLVEIEKLYPEFLSELLQYIKANPDATHVLYDQTSIGKQAILLSIHQKILDAFGFAKGKILGQIVWFFISRAYEYIPNQFWQRFIIQQQQRGIEARELIENLPDVNVPIDTTKALKVKSPGLYFVTIHRDILLGSKEKGIIRVISLGGIDKKLDEDTFSKRVEEWEQQFFSSEVLEDVVLHPKDDPPATINDLPKSPTLEAQAVNNLDRIENIGNLANAAPADTTQQVLPATQTTFLVPVHEELQLAPEAEKEQPKELEKAKAFAFTINNQDLETPKLPDHIFTNTKLQIQTVLRPAVPANLYSLTSKQLFDLAEQKRQEEEKEEREKNRKLVEAILARKQEGINYLAISGKKLPLEFREDFRPLLTGLDKKTVDKIINKRNFSIEIALINCGNERCMQGCKNDPPVPSHPNIRLRAYSERDLYFEIPKNFPVYKYLNAKEV